ncbi:Uncharacterised protein [Mycobacterium tuberculosis]|nr:Uncharacterised protein [Mycobacterium tuberculosis]
MARLTVTTRRACRANPMIVGMVCSSSRMVTPSAVCRVRSAPAPMATAARAAAMAGASLTPSPTSSTW